MARTTGGKKNNSTIGEKGKSGIESGADRRVHSGTPPRFKDSMRGQHGRDGQAARKLEKFEPTPSSFELEAWTCLE